MDIENLSVLVIEDNEGDFILVEDFLIETYKKVHIQRCVDVKSVADCFNQRKEGFTIVLLDLHLPESSGFALINEIIKICNGVPIIALTGYADLTMARKSLEMGIHDFLIKDELNPSLLQKSIDFALSRRSFISQIAVERENYKNLFNLSPQPMWLLHPDCYTVLDINEAAIEKYGYSFEECTTMSFLEFHPNAERENIQEKLSGNPSQSGNSRFTHVTKNGQEIIVELSIKRMQFNSGLKGVIVQSTDISNIVSYIDLIELQNEKLRNIAWKQSHVVRAPLSRILGIITLIEIHNYDLDDLTFWLEQLKISSNEMDEIVKTIVEEAQLIKPENPYA